MPTNSLPPVRATLLGTGTSIGIPVIGCSCAVCTSSDPRDTRTRTACWVEVGGLSLVIDTGPDFRQQALRHDIRQVDAVLYTHHHFDHVAGMEDLRPFLFYNRTSIPCYARPNIAEYLQRRYAYIWEHAHPSAPHLQLCVVEDAFDVRSRYGVEGCVRVTPIKAQHGDLPIYGYRIGRFAYLTDITALSESEERLLEGIDVLVLGALHHKPHPSHLTIAEAVELGRRIGARQTIFVHMTHSILHATEDAALPDDMQLGYDGLTLRVA